MGDTQYWSLSKTDPKGSQARWAAIWPQLVEDAEKIWKSWKLRKEAYASFDLRRGIHIGGDDTDIVHESFEFGPKLGRFNCCKTRGKPYEEIVCAILLRGWMLAGDAIEISSEVTWEEGWDDAARRLKKLWPGETVTRPPTIEGSDD